MKVAIIVCALLAFGLAGESMAQCPNCNPPQPVAQANTPQVIWVRRRCGLFGWRSRWVLQPVFPGRPVAVMGYTY